MKFILDENIKEQKFEKFKDGSGFLKAYMHIDQDNKILRATLEKGCSIGIHEHTDSSEIVYIISGKGKAICDQVVEELLPGNIHYCPKGSSHTLINECDEPLVFFAVIPTHRG